VKHSNNLRQLAMGFLAYADDNKATLPARKQPWANSDFGANRFYLNAASVYDIDLRTPVTQYGTMAATANVLMGTPPLNDPGNSNTVVLCANFAWFPGNGLLARQDSPIKLSSGTPGMAMMMDGLQADPTVTLFYATNCPRVTPQQFYSGNVSSQFCLTTSVSEIPGLFAVRYDASVRWVPYPQIVWLAYGNGWRNSYISP
jgi:hypothetical protein